MPSKHIQDKVWEEVKDEYVRAVVITKSGFKETEILNLLIKKGIESIKDEDYIKLAMEKKK
ncbi:hypothetical protein [Neisseria yangbaofengii]|uniref:hypothetical protein n=1 Tax=Neisseria yangbaofengii TaxID=2709396 RepID=UPI0013EB5667|nr:hypothetical protein [Neisseria yangbaofengii]